MKKELKFKEILENIIGDINEAKRKANSIYSAGNIKTSGDEVEDLIREKISLFLPERYLVKQGHIVNSEGKVSNQFDIIIFDRLSTPKFFESKNQTVFYPIESVLAVGEIKKTLRQNDLVDFGKKIKFLKVDMKRQLIENTFFGEKLNPSTTLNDMMNMSSSKKYKNSLFSFIFAIDEEKIDDLEIDDSNEFMPNDIYILNWGFYIYGKMENEKLIPKIIDEESDIDGLIEVRKSGILCLATMFNQLINHLNNSKIEPFSISHYMTDKDIYGADPSLMKVYNVKQEKKQ
ncbi:DUF6602 domain-containing protein [Flavobacterium ginsengiterrae]|uniref:DUF6602 domain-containing protein n=1 Tax=Flavobacterium ginsengiterrae TaxID=871695 RepID=A0ABP7GDI1_9FLAO